ncbi:MAG: hypothetical protein RLN69_06025 [Woeseiaceae bacterium]
MSIRCFHVLAVTAVLCSFGSSAFAADNAAAMVMRIEPADSGIAKVIRDGKSMEVEFMMPLYEGDELVVESVNTVVQVKIFGGDNVEARQGEPLKIGEEAEERTMLSSMFSALSDKVFRNNQVSRRNLVTRSDGDTAALALQGFSAEGEPQKLVAGRRELFLSWNLDLDSVDYRIVDKSGERIVATGSSEGDYAFVDEAGFESGHEYQVIVESASGKQAIGQLVAVDSRPALSPATEDLGAAGSALQLLELAETDDGRWKFEAIQGVLDLSPDDIDRATLIEEIAAL